MLVNGVDESIEMKIVMCYVDNYCNNWIFDIVVFGEFLVDFIVELVKLYDISFMKIDEL